MDFQKLVTERHAVKKFDGKRISTEEIKQIISTASLAPSGINIQSWHFVIVESNKARAALIPEINPSNKKQIQTAGAVLLLFADPDYAGLSRLIAERAGDSLSEIDKERYIKRYVAYVDSFSPEYLNTYMSWTSGLITMNLLYAIYNAGYKANVVRGFKTQKINEILNIDARFRPEFIIPIGSSDETGEASFRLSLDDIAEVR
ncbi:MAG TPA: nitroreductase family protein [Lactovum miscens]|uniref:nitroreductase family protein n=1 Tax=Lactovum miscens TaxID=190387 RepID=UPI002ED8852D